MARLIRAYDWVSTPLGLLASWPQSLKTVVDLMLSSPNMMSLVWGDEAIHLYNDSFMELLHEHRTLSLGRSAYETFARSRDVFASDVANGMAGRSARLLEQRYPVLRHGSLEHAWFDADYVPVRNDAGDVNGVLWTLKEVTGRKLAEQALRESEIRHRLMIGSWAQATWEVNADGVVVTDSPSWRSYTGQMLEEWLGCGWLDAIHPDDRSYAEQQWREAVAARALVDAEFRLRAPDGGWRWTNVRAAPVFDARGNIEKWVGMNIDIDPRKRAEAMLRKREADLARVQRIGAVGGLDIDVAGGMISRRSPEYLRLHGLPPTSCDETHAEWCARVHPDDIEQAEQVLSSVLDGDAISYHGEYRIIRPSDGAVRWIAARADVERDAAGKALRLVGAHIDITEQRNVQEALRESEERFAQFAASSSEGLWIRDATTLAMEYVSPAIETIYGVSRDSILGDMERWASLILPEDRDTAISHILQAQSGASVTHEFRIRRPSDGALRWIRNTDFPLRDGTGHVQRIGGIAQDVTTIKAAEAALTHSEGRLRDLVEGVSQLVWRAIHKGEWIWASPQWTAFTGQAEVDSHGRGWLGPIHPDDRPIAHAAWDQVDETRGFEVEYRIRNAATGAYRWFQTRAAPRLDAQGEVVEWLGTSTDVHQLKALQESQAVMVAELQHRTRNLIAVVRGIADDTMEHTGPTEAFRSALQDRLTALSRVQGLLSRAEVEPITIAAVVRLELDALGASRSGERVTVAGPDVWLRNSTVQTLALALHELATNARKYGALSHERGQLTVTWSERSEGDERRLVLEWVETGLEHSPKELQPVSEGSGYGRELIEQALPHSLGARTSYTLDETGVRCTIDLPVRQDVQRGGTSRPMAGT